jgi:hypothetical protein
VREPDDDARWREIVDNYGDRAELMDEDVLALEDVPQKPERDDVQDLLQDEGEHAAWADDGADEATEDRADRFVPPTPPPVPRPEPRRLLAWIGLFGAPVLLLAALVFRVPMPSLVSIVLGGWFVGGFAYLVLEMPRGPRDPGDDGARI